MLQNKLQHFRVAFLFLCNINFLFLNPKKFVSYIPQIQNKKEYIYKINEII